jgi:hypothetical protein
MLLSHVQVALVIRFIFFAYQRFYFSIMRSINILSTATVEAAAQAHWVARAVSLTLPTILTPGTINQDLSRRITQKNPRACYTSPVLRVFSIRGDSQERDPRVWREPPVIHNTLLSAECVLIIQTKVRFPVASTLKYFITKRILILKLILAYSNYNY